MNPIRDSQPLLEDPAVWLTFEFASMFVPVCNLRPAKGFEYPFRGAPPVTVRQRFWMGGIRLQCLDKTRP
jgi:hypothetical protein